jgi:hypothetical protein
MLCSMSAPSALHPARGRTASRILVAGLVLSFVATVYLLTRGDDGFGYALLLTIVCAVALVALPAVLFTMDSRREPRAELTRPMRAAVLFSALCLVATGAWSVFVLGGAVWIGAGAVVGAFGILTLVRAWRTAPVAAGTQRLAYGGSTVLGVFVLLIMAMAVPKFACGCGEKPYEAVLKSDLRNLATAQQAFLLDHHRYGSGAELDSMFYRTTGDSIVVVAHDSSAWHAIGSHRNLPARQCGIWVGVRPADGMDDAMEGEPKCWTP